MASVVQTRYTTPTQWPIYIPVCIANKSTKCGVLNLNIPIINVGINLVNTLKARRCTCSGAFVSVIQ